MLQSHGPTGKIDVVVFNSESEILTMCSNHSYPRTYEDASDDFDELYSSSYDYEDEYVEEYIDSRGGIDKCMNCGRYKYNDELSYPGQTCIKGCVNPNEY